MLPQQESHEMVFERVVAEDTDELFCPVCGRRILVQWSPDFKKIVLEAGNEYAIHTASKGVHETEASQAALRKMNETANRMDEEDRQVTSGPDITGEAMEFWEKALEAIKFESCWHEGLNPDKYVPH